ncbi:biotin--protein ligase [Candidatus Peregrinibacteria bacterium]|nr:biotin--protein ligase [Candidatus Peregrinibacteria bacterium]
MYQAVYKVPNGKLLKIFFELKDDKISEIKITGDFFLYPEEKITLLEEAITGCALKESELKAKLDSAIKNEKLELFGIDTESIVKAIFLAK